VLFRQRSTSLLYSWTGLCHRLYLPPWITSCALSIPCRICTCICCTVLAWNVYFLILCIKHPCRSCSTCCAYFEALTAYQYAHSLACKSFPPPIMRPLSIYFSSTPTFTLVIRQCKCSHLNFWISEVRGWLRMCIAGYRSRRSLSSTGTSPASLG
jgi:hypothetical protein